jgi:DNA-binding transcriptional LysR family regulator
MPVARRSSRTGLAGSPPLGRARLTVGSTQAVLAAVRAGAGIGFASPGPSSEFVVWVREATA